MTAFCWLGMPVQVFLVLGCVCGGGGAGAVCC